MRAAGHERGAGKSGDSPDAIAHDLQRVIEQGA
jgi:hypothetical protein